MKPIKTLDFLEVYLSNYYSSDLIAWIDDCARFLNDELTPEEIKEKKLDKLSVSEVFSEYSRLSNKVFDQAIRAFVDDICKRQKENVCRNFLDNEHHDTDGIIMSAEQPSIFEVQSILQTHTHLLFTGVPDRNGAKINVGDIIREFHEEEGTGFTEWIIYYDKKLKELVAVSTIDDGVDTYFRGIDTENCDKIGTVHKNPELVHIDISSYDFSAHPTPQPKVDKETGIVENSEWWGDFFYGKVAVVRNHQDYHSIQAMVSFDYNEQSKIYNEKTVIYIEEISDFIESKLKQKGYVCTDTYDNVIDVSVCNLTMDVALTMNDEFKELFKNVTLNQVLPQQLKREDVVIGDTKLDSKQLLELLQKKELTVESVTVNGRKGTAVLKMDKNNKIEKQFYPKKIKQNLDTYVKPKTSKSTKKSPKKTEKNGI
jgi:hypothetical protein